MKLTNIGMSESLPIVCKNAVPTFRRSAEAEHSEVKIFLRGKK